MKNRKQTQEPNSERIIIARAHWIEILVEATNSKATLREWKRVKHVYKLADGNYLFSWIPCLPDQPHGPIDFDSIEGEARKLRKKLRLARTKCFYKK